MSLKRLLLTATLGLCLSLAWTSLALAAANDYTVTGVDIAALPNVGAASTVLASSAITITDAGGDDFTNDPEALIFAINTTNYPNVAFDSTVATLTIAGNCGYTTLDSLVYSSSDQVATATISGGTNCGAGELITVAGLKVKTTYAASAPGANPIVTVDNSTTSPGTYVAGNNVNLATLVGDLTSTNVEPSSLTVASTSTNTISFTTTAAIPNLGIIKITYPSGFDVSGVNGRTAGGLSGLDGTWTASVSGQVVTLTQTGGGATAAGAKSLTLSDIRTPSSTGSTGTYTILTEIAAGNDIETDAAVTADTIIGGSQASVVIGNVTGVTVTGDAESGVTVTWSDPAGDDSTHITVLRGVSPYPVNGVAYATIAKGVEEFLDTDISEGDVLTYQLRATDGSDTGTLTTAVSYTVPANSTDDTTDTTDTTGDTTGDDTTDNTTDDTTGDDTAGDDTTDETTDTTGDTATDDTTGDTTGDTTEDTAESGFEDTAGHWAEDKIDFMVTAGVVEGNPDGTFDPDGQLNRAEAATLVYRIVYGEETPTAPTENPFTDVDMNAWYAGYITRLADHPAVINGNPDGTFEPGEFMNRAEFLELAMNAYELDNVVAGVSMTDRYEDLDTSAWYAEMVSEATSLGFVQGSTCEGGYCFNAASTITRAEATTILYNMFSDVL